MKLDLLAAQIRRWPDRYLWFGPWWWVVKAAMRDAGLPVGHADEPGTRAVLERAAGGRAAALKAAMRCFEEQSGSFPNHHFTLPDGEAYFLHDDDVGAAALT